MSLQTRLSALITAIGADIKTLNNKTRFGTAVQMAAIDPTTVPAGTEFIVTNDATWGKARYMALGSPQTWTLIDVLNSLSGREIGSIEITGTFDNATAGVVNAGAALSITAPGVDYRIIAHIPNLGATLATVRAMASLYDETSTLISSVFSVTNSTNATNGSSVTMTTKKISGIAAGTTKSYQLVSVRTAENTGTNRVASQTVTSIAIPIILRAVIA